MTLPEHACRAYELSQDLTLGELHVLVTSFSIDKGTHTRAFAIRELTPIAVRKHLEDHDYDPEQAVEGLIEKDFIQPPRSGGETRRTTDGDLVAHAFREIRRRLSYMPTIPYGDAHSISNLPDVKESLRKMCEDYRGSE